MQETRYEGQVHQRVFTGQDEDDLMRQMNEALRPGEEVIRRREMTQPEFNGFNRHELRKAQAIARRSK